MGDLTRGEVVLHYREDGVPGGAPVIFSNSLGTDLHLWDGLLPFLPAGLRIIRYDTRGHGASSVPPAPYAMAELVADAEALIDHLGLRAAVFVGLSIGGMTGQGLAARRPDLLRGLVLSNTAAKIGTPEMWQARIAALRAGGLAALADGVLERWFSGGFLASGQAGAWREMLLRQPEEGYAGCCAALAGADLREATRGLRLPVLGIAGAEDGATPPDLVRETVALVPGARYHLIPGAGHLPCVEKPQDFADELTGFLRETGHI